jgi:hypothetical protein
MHIQKPVLGQLTQGTLFTGATAEHYPLLPVWGLCITARCDMAREIKVQVFNYVPVIRYEDWLRGDGAKLISERIEADLLGKMKSILEENKKSVSVLESYSPLQIATTLLPGNTTFATLAQKFDICTHIRRETRLTSARRHELVSINRKISEKLVKELWANQLVGFYFLDDLGITDHPSSNGYVVMLREIHHLPRNVASAIAGGYLIAEYPMAGTNEFCSKTTPFDFAHTTGVIKSPWIEHILQQFSIMFSRIGLPDPKPQTLKLLHEAMSYVD